MDIVVFKGFSGLLDVLVHNLLILRVVTPVFPRKDLIGRLSEVKQTAWFLKRPKSPVMVLTGKTGGAGRFTLSALAKKYLGIRVEKYPTSKRQASIIQLLLPALAATQEWTAEKLLRLAPSVKFKDVLNAVGVGEEYRPHLKAILPEILMGKTGCPGCLVCTGKPNKGRRTTAKRNRNKTKRNIDILTGKRPKEEVLPTFSSCSDSD